jgi:restriction system protein
VESRAADCRIWAIHNDRRDVSFVDGGFVGIGWARIGDLRAIGADREALRAALQVSYPEKPPRAIAAWAGMLLRFGFELGRGDLVVHPDKADRTLALGRIAGSYEYLDSPDTAVPHRRRVEWLANGIPRDAFSSGALHEIGATLTLFRVRRHASELRAFLGLPNPPEQ